MEDRSSRRMRTLVTQLAHRGLSDNETARALISMMVRSKIAPIRDRIHWCKTADASLTKPLATHGRTIHWVNRVTLTARRWLPVYPNKQTCSAWVGMSQTCQQRSSAF